MLAFAFSCAVLVDAKCPFQHLLGNQAPEPDLHLVKPFLRRSDQKKLESAPDPQQNTATGCQCSSSCGGTLDDLGTCDWCYTKNGCGHRSVSSLGFSYDYCVYPPDVSFDQETAAQKMTQTWAKVAADSTPGKFPFPSVPLNPGIFAESMRTTFDNMRDEMPAGRPKYIHAQGMVCKVNLNVVSTKYTGIFQHGNAKGLLRLGSALPVTPITGIVPGIGMKFFRSNKPSANWVMLHSLAPQIGDTYDMFHYTQYNHIAAPPVYALALAEKFKQASGCIEMVGLSDVCTYTQDGQEVANPQFPYKVEYRTGDASMPAGGCGPDELLKRMLAAGKKGVKLYDVYAYESPTAQAELLGSLTVTENDCVTSKYGDEKLFIRHQRIEEDWAKRPEWIPDIKDAECGGASIQTIVSTRQPKCSEKTEALEADLTDCTPTAQAKSE